MSTKGAIVNITAINYCGTSEQTSCMPRTGKVKIEKLQLKPKREVKKWSCKNSVKKYANKFVYLFRQDNQYTMCMPIHK